MHLPSWLCLPACPCPPFVPFFPAPPRPRPSIALLRGPVSFARPLSVAPRAPSPPSRAVYAAVLYLPPSARSLCGWRPLCPPCAPSPALPLDFLWPPSLASGRPLLWPLPPFPLAFAAALLCGSRLFVSSPLALPFGLRVLFSARWSPSPSAFAPLPFPVSPGLPVAAPLPYPAPSSGTTPLSPRFPAGSRPALFLLLFFSRPPGLCLFFLPRTCCPLPAAPPPSPSPPAPRPALPLRLFLRASPKALSFGPHCQAYPGPPRGGFVSPPFFLFFLCLPAPPGNLLRGFYPLGPPRLFPVSFSFWLLPRLPLPLALCWPLPPWPACSVRAWFPRPPLYPPIVRRLSTPAPGPRCPPALLFAPPSLLSFPFLSSPHAGGRSPPHCSSLLPFAISPSFHSVSPVALLRVVAAPPPSSRLFSLSSAAFGIFSLFPFVRSPSFLFVLFPAALPTLSSFLLDPSLSRVPWQPIYGRSSPFNRFFSPFSRVLPWASLFCLALVFFPVFFPFPPLAFFLALGPLLGLSPLPSLPLSRRSSPSSLPLPTSHLPVPSLFVLPPRTLSRPFSGRLFAPLPPFPPAPAPFFSARLSCHSIPSLLYSPQSLLLSPSAPPSPSSLRSPSRPRPPVFGPDLTPITLIRAARPLVPASLSRPRSPFALFSSRFLLPRTALLPPCVPLTRSSFSPVGLPPPRGPVHQCSRLLFLMSSVPLTTFPVRLFPSWLFAAPRCLLPPAPPSPSSLIPGAIFSPGRWPLPSPPCHLTLFAFPFACAGPLYSPSPLPSPLTYLVPFRCPLACLLSLDPPIP